MPNVVTPFSRRRQTPTRDTDGPRHRRDGFFDEQDRWHDAEEPESATNHA